MAPTGAPTVAPTPSPTQAPRDTVVPVAEVIPEGDPWNPICNVSEVRLPVVHLERRTFNAVDKDVFAVHIPTKYEVKAWAKFRAKVALNETTSSVEPVWDALVGVKSRGKGLRFVQQVRGQPTPPSRCVK